jgi:hypothetical protein
LIKITDSSDMAHLLLFRIHQGRPEGWKRIATWRFFWKISSKEYALASWRLFVQELADSSAGQKTFINPASAAR